MSADMWGHCDTCVRELETAFFGCLRPSLCLRQLVWTSPHHTTFVTASGHEVDLRETCSMDVMAQARVDRNLALWKGWAANDERKERLPRPLLEPVTLTNKRALRGKFIQRHLLLISLVEHLPSPRTLIGTDSSVAADLEMVRKDAWESVNRIHFRDVSDCYYAFCVDEERLQRQVLGPSDPVSRFRILGDASLDLLLLRRIRTLGVQ